LRLPESDTYIAPRMIYSFRDVLHLCLYEQA
jgi:hypothetical protein